MNVSYNKDLIPKNDLLPDVYHIDSSTASLFPDPTGTLRSSITRTARMVSHPVAEQIPGRAAVRALQTVCNPSGDTVRDWSMA